MGIKDPTTVEFKFTVVQEHSVFWVRALGSNNVEIEPTSSSEPTSEPEGEPESEPEGEPESSPESDPKSEPETAAKKHEIFETCFKDKGCFGVPVGCVDGNSCNLMTTYKAEGGELKMQLFARGLNSGQYVAMAFSDDLSMGEDLVYSCSNGGSTVNAHWNDGKNNKDLDGISITDAKVETKDGVTVCQFTLKERYEITPPGGDDRVTFKLLSGQYHILMSKGSASGRSLKYHGPQNRFQSPKVGR